MTPDLFGNEASGALDPDSEPEAGREAPLAARMRPRSLEEFQGQRHLLAEGKALRTMLERGSAASMILWGPPGSGKTTLARIVAAETGTRFVPFSAVTEGVPRVREIIAGAAERLKRSGDRTILFCDEIHRFNKAQQDAFLPHVEAGTITLIGATTENPSFEIVRPLLSRAPVFVLEPLETGDIQSIMERAVEDAERGLGHLELEVDEGVLEWIARQSDGDARRALGVLEAAATLASDPAATESDEPPTGGRITRALAAEALQHRFAAYDKGGEEHYNLISALHKAVRGSDADGALYWLARMLRGGEDPRYIARRLVRMASEDIGLSDPEALRVALAARDAWHFLGSPEGDLALAQATVYLALAPKSNRVYRAWKDVLSAADDSPAEPVPLHIRNAPTDLMKDLGYGKGYAYDHEFEDGVAPQEYLPDELAGRRFYEPGRFGFEKTLSERLRWFDERRRPASRDGSRDGD